MSVTRQTVQEGSQLRATLAAAMQASGHRLYEFDPVSGRLAWPACPAPAGVFGHTVDRVDTLQAWLALVHPDDRAVARADLEAGVVEPPRGATTTCYRLRDAAGEYRWIEVRGTRMRAGERDLHVGAVVDVTPRRHAEQRLALCALILETIREAVSVTDGTGRILWANAAFGALVGIAREGLAGTSIHDFSCASEARRIEQLQEMRDAIARRGTWQGRVDGRRGDGRPLITEACVSVVDGEQGALWVHVHRDVTERVEMEEVALAASRAEQQRLGLELHDCLGQELAGTSMLVRTLRNAVTAGGTADPVLLRDVETLLQSSVARCRDLAQGVSPFVIDDGGLGAAIQDLVNRARDGHPGAAIHADVCPQAAAFDGNFGCHVFRAAQLSLAMVLGRDDVASVDLQIWCEADDRLVIAVVGDGRDNGGAAEPADERLLRHQLTLLGGSCEPLPAGRGRSGLIAMVPVAAPVAGSHAAGESGRVAPRPEARRA